MHGLERLPTRAEPAPIMAFFALVRAFLKENEADPRLKSDFLDPLKVTD